jgi:riboflavin kinase/FMN adenylyltransferase
MPTAVTIGNFDGVHLGHAALLARARELATPAGRVIVLSFDPHPASVLRPEAAPTRLTTFERRAALLRDLGADEVRPLAPTRELLGLTPEAFVHRVIEEHAAQVFVEGRDFRFGKGRAGDVRTLARLAQARGATADVVPPVRVALTDQTVCIASSTMLRWLIERGRVRDAASMLGRPPELTGVVGRGDRLGRELGFPTANMTCDTALPADGVYAARGILDDGRVYPVALSVGSRPTFDGLDRRVEAHLLDVHPDGSGWAPIPGLPEYGWRLRLELIAWVRDQARFPSVDTLREQLLRDCALARAALAPTMETAS